MSADEAQLTSDPDSATGAACDGRVAAELATVASESIRVLHDRRMPGARTKIDHLVVTPGAVWVVDSHGSSGRPQLRVDGGLGRPRVERLVVDHRDQTALLEAVQRRIDTVEARFPNLPVRGALCFTGGGWLLRAGAFSARGVDVVCPGKLAKLLRSTSLGQIDVAAAATALARVFLPA